MTERVDFASYNGALTALRAANCLEEPRPGVRPRLPVRSSSPDEVFAAETGSDAADVVS